MFVYLYIKNHSNILDVELYKCVVTPKKQMIIPTALI